MYYDYFTYFQFMLLYFIKSLKYTFDLKLEIIETSIDTNK